MSLRIHWLETELSFNSFILLCLHHWPGFDMHTTQCTPSWWQRSLNTVHAIHFWEQNLLIGSVVLSLSKTYDPFWPTTCGISSLIVLFAWCLDQGSQVIREENKPMYWQPVFYERTKIWRVKTMLMHFKWGTPLPLSREN